MGPLQRQRLRSFLAGSLWLVPFGAMLIALPAGRAVFLIDSATQWRLLDFEANGASAVVGTLSAAMFTFVVFVFSFAMLTVQIASAQLSPRIIAFAFRNRGARLGLGLFVFSMTFSLATAARIGERVPQLMVLVTLVLSVSSVATFLYLGDNLVRRLRPVAVATAFGRLGIAVIEDVYPDLLTPGEEPAARRDTPPPGDATRTVRMPYDSAVLLALDAGALVDLAKRADASIEIVPQVGDFVPCDEPLFRIQERGARVDDAALLRSVLFGSERTLEQDPLFVFRILVDIAEKALSPAINDPTTAVLVIDQLHMLLRRAGWRRLADGSVCDETGALRLSYRTPQWADFVALAVSEIRLAGAASLQVVRRLRLMLANLIATLPPDRSKALSTELELLDAAVARSFLDAEDRACGAVADSQGIGSPRGDESAGAGRQSAIRDPTSSTPPGRG